jgi:hypothetical protein
MFRLPGWIGPLAAAVAVAACSPALDWREFVPEGTDLHVTFPCRADRHARMVVLAGAKVRMEMLVCTAGDSTYAVSFSDVADPARVGAMLAEWRGAVTANVQGVAPDPAPIQVKGMTPNEQAVRVVIAGRLPDGAPVQEHAAFFARGLKVYSATVIGARPAAQSVETFFSGLAFAS